VRPAGFFHAQLHQALQPPKSPLSEENQRKAAKVASCTATVAGGTITANGYNGSGPAGSGIGNGVTPLTNSLIAGT